MAVSFSLLAEVCRALPCSLSVILVTIQLRVLSSSTEFIFVFSLPNHRAVRRLRAHFVWTEARVRPASSALPYMKEDLARDLGYRHQQSKSAFINHPSVNIVRVSGCVNFLFVGTLLRCPIHGPFSFLPLQALAVSILLSHNCLEDGF